MSRVQQTSAAALALVVLMGAQSAAWAGVIFKYEYDSVNYLPNTQGWSHGGVNGSTTTLTDNPTDDAVTFTDTDSIIGPYIANSGTITPTDYFGEWIFTIRARFDTTTSAVSWVGGVNTGPRYWNLWFDAATGNVQAYNDGPIITIGNVPTMGSAFHTYELRGNGGVAAPQLWIDGVNTGNVTGGYTTGSSGDISFGAFWSGGTTGVANVQLIQFESLPEPASLGLLSLGGLLLLRKRR